MDRIRNPEFDGPRCIISPGILKKVLQRIGDARILYFFVSDNRLTNDFLHLNGS